MMAIVSTTAGSRVQVIVQTGTDAQGEPVLKSRSYNRIKSDAADEVVYQFAAIIAGLQKHTFYGVNRVNEVALEEV
ncbi:MAG: DUF1659 domain-containing protein [Peptococcaceae bacterium]